MDWDRAVAPNKALDPAGAERLAPPPQVYRISHRTCLGRLYRNWRRMPYFPPLALGCLMHRSAGVAELVERGL